MATPRYAVVARQQPPGTPCGGAIRGRGATNYAIGGAEMAPPRRVGTWAVGGCRTTPTQTGNLMTTPPPQPTTCPILHLDLGPLNLNLLGLRVHLDQEVREVTGG